MYVSKIDMTLDMTNPGTYVILLKIILIAHISY